MIMRPFSLLSAFSAEMVRRKVYPVVAATERPPVLEMVAFFMPLWTSPNR